jgi:hypothetical protein
MWFVLDYVFENVGIMDNVLFLEYMLDDSLCWGWNMFKLVALLISVGI